MGKIHFDKLTKDDAFDVCIALSENQTTSNEYYSSSSLRENVYKKVIPEEALQNKTLKYTYAISNIVIDYKEITLCRENFSLMYDITVYEMKRTSLSIKNTKNGNPYRVHIPTYNDRSYHDFTYNETEEIFRNN